MNTRILSALPPNLVVNYYANTTNDDVVPCTLFAYDSIKINCLPRSSFLSLRHALIKVT